jgi:hypothetical protein
MTVSPFWVTKDPPVQTSPAAPKTPETPTAEDEATAVILEKAIKAKQAGDHATSDVFFKAYASLVTSGKPLAATEKVLAPHANLLAMPVSKALSSEATLASIVSFPVSAREETKVGNTVFAWGNNNSHDDVGFTPYFEKNIQELKGPIPLTIFNKAWQDEAIAYHAEKRTKSDDNSTDKGTRYTGLPYPSEWRMTFNEWTLNHREFQITMRDVYKYETLSTWLLMHKANADRIQKKSGFMTALRYDIRIRANAFAHRVVKDGKITFSDISILREDTLDTAYGEARRFNELEFTDNPYAIGGPRASWDPHSGSKPATKNSTSNSTTQRMNGQGAPSSLPARPREAKNERRSGYKGSNFNPNYSDQRHQNNGARAQNQSAPLP